MAVVVAPVYGGVKPIGTSTVRRIWLNGLQIKSAQPTDAASAVSGWWDVSNIDGWGGSSNRATITERTYRPGADVSGVGLASQSMTITGFFEVYDAVSLQNAEDALRAAATLDQFTIVVEEPGRTRWRYARRIGNVATSWAGYRMNYTIDLVSEDPRLYGQQYSLALYSVSPSDTGVVFPLTFPITFPDYAGTSGTVTNSGNWPATPIFTITGPCMNPSVEVNGHTIEWNLSLGYRQQIVVNPEIHRGVYAGGGIVDPLMTSRDWQLLPVGQSTLNYATADHNPLSTLTTVWTDTWN